MDEKQEGLIVPESSTELQAGELNDEQLDDFNGGLTVVKNANCQSNKGALNSVVTLEASLKL